MSSPFRGILLEWERVVLRPPSRVTQVLPDDASYEDITAGFSVYDDARALLASLRYRGYRCGTLSQSSFAAAEIERHCQRLGLGGYIDSVTTLSSTPDLRAAIENAHRTLRLAGSEVLLVCSSTALMEAAAASNIPARQLRRSGGGDIASLASVHSILGEGIVL